MKVWCIRQENSALSIDMKANICCVKYNPGSSYNIAVSNKLSFVELRLFSDIFGSCGGLSRIKTVDKICGLHS